jgi:hypothetical protein
MPCFRTHLTIASIALLALASCTRQTVAADALAKSAPAIAGVWWSPTLELKSLRDIDARLGAPFPDAVEMARGREVVEAANCRALLDLRSKGYEAAGGSLGYARERHFGAVCTALTALNAAAAPKTSHLADFRLTPQAIGVMPPILAASFIHADGAALEAEARGLSWREFEPKLVARMDGEELVVTGSTWEVRAEIYARGDFNGDGLDDLMVRAAESATGGSYASTRLVLLTRREPRGKLTTLRRLQ